MKVFEKKLFCIHEYTVGHRVTFKQVAKGKISHGLLDSSDVFVLDNGFHVYVWVGNDASTLEKGRALILAQVRREGGGGEGRGGGSSSWHR